MSASHARGDAGVTENRPLFSVHFRPHPGLLSQTRAFISSLCGTFLDDPDLVFRIAMTVHELLENAIKYSLDGETDVRIDLRTGQGERRLAIRTDNRASGESIAAMRPMIHRLHAAEDPFAFYCELVRASAGDSHGSGLGLARICAEAGLQIDSAVVGDRVSVFAEARLDQGAAA